jgi:hypothetical protein
LTYKTSPIGRSELATVLKKSKIRKASGIDAIMADIMMELEKKSRLRSLKMIDTWWQEGNTPKTSTSASVSSLYKTGDPNALSNYIPISLLNTEPSNL